MDIYMAKIQSWAYDPDKDVCSVTKLSPEDITMDETSSNTHQPGYSESVSFHRTALSASLCTFSLPDKIEYKGMSDSEIEGVKAECSKACNLILRGLEKPAAYYDTISFSDVMKYKEDMHRETEREIGPEFF